MEERNPEIEVATEGKKLRTCFLCKVEKPLAEYYSRAGARYAYSVWCKSCRRVKAVECVRHLRLTKEEVLEWT